MREELRSLRGSLQSKKDTFFTLGLGYQDAVDKFLLKCYKSSMKKSTMLYDYSRGDFEALEALKLPGAHRWNGRVELYQMGLPAPNAVLFRSIDTYRDALNKIEAFHRVVGDGNFAPLRYDLGPYDRHASPMMPVENYGFIFNAVKQAVDEGFTPSLNAFAHRYRTEGSASMGISFVSEDSIIIELIGPGHDGGCICGGGMDIPVIISMKPNSPGLLEVMENPSHLQHHIDIWDEKRELTPNEIMLRQVKRSETRLRFLADLHGRSVYDEADELTATKRDSFLNEELSYDMAEIETLFGFAVMMKKFFGRKGLPVTHKTVTGNRVKGWMVDNLYDETRWGR